jgi:hypothetical protein
LEDGLDAMFDDVGIFVVLDFVENDIDELGFGEDQLFALKFNKVIKHWPNILDKMRAKAPQSRVKINKNLRLTTVNSQLFEQRTIHINRNRIGSLRVNITTKEHSVDE